MVSAEEIRRRFGAELSGEEVKDVLRAVEGAEDRHLLAAYIASGVFARRIGDPVMGDELGEERHTAHSPPPADVRSVIGRVRSRGHPGAVRRWAEQEERS